MQEQVGVSESIHMRKQRDGWMTLISTSHRVTQEMISMCTTSPQHDTASILATRYVENNNNNSSNSNNNSNEWMSKLTRLLNDFQHKFPWHEYESRGAQTTGLSKTFMVHLVQGQSTYLMDAVWFGCVPVIISDHCDLPLQGLVDWSKFAVFVREVQVLCVYKSAKKRAHLLRIIL